MKYFVWKCQIQTILPEMNANYYNVILFWQWKDSQKYDNVWLICYSMRNKNPLMIRENKPFSGPLVLVFPSYSHLLMSPNQALFTSIQQRIITYPPFPALHILLITDVRQWKQLVQTVPHLLLSEVISCITPDPVKCINTTKQSMIKLRFGFRFNQDHLRCCTPKMQERTWLLMRECA